MPVDLLVWIFGVQSKEAESMKPEPVTFSVFLNQCLIEWRKLKAEIGEHILGKSPDVVMIGRKRVTSCLTCKMHSEKDNPVMPAMPIVKCMEENRINYNPGKIPRWCPYANKK